MLNNQLTTTEKVSIAAQFLRSEWNQKTEQCVYRDDATQDHYTCTSEDELVELYELITDSDDETSRDAYSIWCGQTTHNLY